MLTQAQKEKLVVLHSRLDYLNGAEEAMRDTLHFLNKCVENKPGIRTAAQKVSIGPVRKILARPEFGNIAWVRKQLEAEVDAIHDEQ